MRKPTHAVLAAALLVAAPSPGRAQGWIEAPGVERGGFSVEKVRSEVRVSVEGRVARVEVSEWFVNEGARPAEGDYLYPLPGEAVFEGFSLFQGDAELRGEIMDAGEARRIYEEIVRKHADPALIELAGHGLLRARVFPIQVGETRRVTLRFSEVLPRAGSALHFQYAGGVGSVPSPSLRGDPSSGLVPEPVETDFELVVDDGAGFLDPFSPTHDVEVTRDGARLTVRVPGGEIRGRFSLFLPFEDEVVGLTLATHRLPGEDGYFMLTVSPSARDLRPEPRDLTVVLDVSGSMSGEKIAQARAALRDLLNSLSSDDRFRLLAFSSSVHMNDDRWTDADDAGRRAGWEWVADLKADGGTNIGAALEEAFRLESPPDRLPVVVFLTDGLPSVGVQSPEELARRAERMVAGARIFAFGVGHDVNTYLLDRMSMAGRGTTAYVTPGESVEGAISTLAAKIRHPVLTDLRLAGAPVRLTEVYPVEIPDVFSAEELVLFGRYQATGEGRIGVEGMRQGRRLSFVTEAAFPRVERDNAYLPRLWASRKLGYLTRLLWTQGPRDELVEEIQRLALRYGLPSEYTSYLVREPDVLAVAPGPGGRRRAAVDLARRMLRLPEAPAQATGAGAVRRADEARRFREMKSVQELDSVGLSLAQWVVTGRSPGTTRAAAGRLFHLDDGVWTDVAYEAGGRQVVVKAFSPAHMALMEALPELAPVFREMSRVVVAGATLSLRVTDEGVEELPQSRMEELVRAFRGDPAAP